MASHKRLDVLAGLLRTKAKDDAAAWKASLEKLDAIAAGGSQGGEEVERPE